MPILARDHSNYLHELQETWNKEPPTRRIPERSKGDKSPYVLPTSQNPPCWNPSCLSDAGVTRKDFEQRWLATDNPEINPITIKSQTVAEQPSWIPLHCSSLPRAPFPRKSLASSSRVCPLTIHFCMLDKSPLSGPRRGSPYL